MTSFDQSLRDKFSKLNQNRKDEIKSTLQLLFPSVEDIVDEFFNGIFILEKFIDCDDDYDVINDGVNSEDEYEEFNETKENNLCFKIEIMSQSAAFQKVFASLVLLLTLSENKSLNKYYLIDEPDVLLDQRTSMTYVNELKKLSEKYSIKLIITTTNTNITELFDENIFL